MGELFARNVEKYQRIIVSMRKSQPYSHCDMLDTLFLVPNAVSLSELETAFQQITLEGVQKQHRRMLAQMFVEGFVYGNVNAQRLEPLCDIIDQCLLLNLKDKYGKGDVAKARSGCLALPPKQSYVVSMQCPNTEDKNSCISTTFLLQSDSIAHFIRLKLFSHLMNAPCFDSLRTKQQLGYIVWSFADRVRGWLSLRVMVQSNVANPNKLNARFEAFLGEFRAILEAMNEEQFETNKTSVVNNLREKTKSIYEQNGRFWAEIQSARFEFERHETLAKAASDVRREDMLKFYDTFIGRDAEQRTKLTVQCYGNAHAMDLSEVAEEDKESRYVDEGAVVWTEADVQSVREKLGYRAFPYAETAKL